jgi:hypothetical protein
MEPTKIYPIIALLSLVTVEYGGWALLTFLTGLSGQLRADGVGRPSGRAVSRGALPQPRNRARVSRKRRRE